MIPALVLRAWPYALAATVAAGLYGWGRHDGYGSAERSYSPIVRKYEDANVALAAAVAQDLRRAQDEVKKVSERADNEINHARRDAAAASAAAVGLRNHVAALARACETPTPTGTGQAAATPGVVLADVFSRLDARAGELAEAFDRARSAGLACEALSD